MASSHELSAAFNVISRYLINKGIDHPPMFMRVSMVKNRSSAMGGRFEPRFFFLAGDMVYHVDLYPVGAEVTEYNEASKWWVYDDLYTKTDRPATEQRFPRVVVSNDGQPDNVVYLDDYHSEETTHEED